MRLSLLSTASCWVPLPVGVFEGESEARLLVGEEATTADVPMRLEAGLVAAGHGSMDVAGSASEV